MVTLYKKVEEIYHEHISGGNTHEYWKMVMEGYEESNTLSSRDNYKYREYVKPGQKNVQNNRNNRGGHYYKQGQYKHFYTCTYAPGW